MRQGRGCGEKKKYERQNTTHGQFSVEKIDGSRGHGPLQAAEGILLKNFHNLI